MPIAFIFMLVGIAVLVIGGIVMGYSVLHGSTASSVATDEATITSSAQSLYASTGDYSTIASDEASVIPVNMQSGSAGGVYPTPVGGNWVLASPAATEFTVGITGASLTAKECERIITQIPSLQTSVDGTAVTGQTPGQAVDPSSAASACAAGTSSSGGITALSFLHNSSQ